MKYLLQGMRSVDQVKGSSTEQGMDPEALFNWGANVVRSTAITHPDHDRVRLSRVNLDGLGWWYVAYACRSLDERMSGAEAREAAWDDLIDQCGRAYWKQRA